MSSSAKGLLTMCYAFTLRRERTDLVELFDIQSIQTIIKNSSNTAARNFIAARSTISVIRHHYGKRSLDLLRWGSDFPTGFLYNARDDKLLTSRYWKAAFHKQRCLIPADGWYDLHQAKPEGSELTKEEAARLKMTRKGKKQYFFHLENDTVFAMAGVYGNKTNSAIVITTESAPSILHLHNRMPAIIHRDHWAAYLDPKISSTKAAQIIKPLKEDILYFPSPKPVERIWLE